MKRFLRNTTLRWVLAAIAIFLVALILLGNYGLLGSGIERHLYQLQPSASRAYLHGERHFDASSSRLYDIDAAQWYFAEVARLDPGYPGVYHELARIAFLRGDLAFALSLINLHIRKHGEDIQSSFYVRGLIEGYMGRYDNAIEDYETFLQSRPRNWAALNDYAWVLLKADRPEDAHWVAVRGLVYFPDNAWLLNTDAIALYEMGDLTAAASKARAASSAFEHITRQMWLTAYPGNDPKVAELGIETLRASIFDNMHSIERAMASSTVQSMH